jgi:hypothetical protein
MMRAILHSLTRWQSLMALAGDLDSEFRKMLGQPDGPDTSPRAARPEEGVSVRIA